MSCRCCFILTRDIPSVVSKPKLHTPFCYYVIRIITSCIHERLTKLHDQTLIQYSYLFNRLQSRQFFKYLQKHLWNKCSNRTTPRLTLKKVHFVFFALATHFPRWKRAQHLSTSLLLYQIKNLNNLEKSKLAFNISIHRCL